MQFHQDVLPPPQGKSPMCENTLIQLITIDNFFHIGHKYKSKKSRVFNQEF